MSTPQEAHALDCNTCLSPGSFMNQRFAGVQLLRFVAAMLFAVIGGLILIFSIDWNASTDRLISWGAGAALLVMGAVWLEPWTAATRPARALSFLGDSSYSIYLSHTFVVPAAVMALHKLGVQESFIVIPAVLLVVVLSGCISYLWLERPMTSFFKRIFFAAPEPAYQNHEVHHAK